MPVVESLLCRNHTKISLSGPVVVPGIPSVPIRPAGKGKRLCLGSFYYHFFNAVCVHFGY